MHAYREEFKQDKCTQSARGQNIFHKTHFQYTQHSTHNGRIYSMNFSRTLARIDSTNTHTHTCVHTNTNVSAIAKRRCRCAHTHTIHIHTNRLRERSVRTRAIERDGRGGFVQNSLNFPWKIERESERIPTTTMYRAQCARGTVTFPISASRSITNNYDNDAVCVQRILHAPNVFGYLAISRSSAMLSTNVRVFCLTTPRPPNTIIQLEDHQQYCAGQIRTLCIAGGVNSAEDSARHDGTATSKIVCVLDP